MASVLCSDSFRLFFEKVKTNIYDVNALLSHIAIHLPPVARELHIGALKSVLNEPVSPQSREFRKRVKSLYVSELGAEETMQVRHNEAIYGEHVDYEVYPEKGHKFTDEEMAEIDFLLDNIFLLTSRIRMMNMLKESELTDSLTGVSNAAGIVRFGNILQAKGNLDHYSAVMFNLKNFKLVNQMLGARNGDRLLTEVARHVKGFLRMPEEQLARLGSDSYIVLVRRERENEIVRALASMKINLNLGSIIRVMDVQTRMGVFRMGEESTMSDVLTNTSVALNFSRSPQGGDIAYFSYDMLARSMHSKEISQKFRKALNNREFVVYYQPKVDMTNNRIIGAEALVRWIQEGKIVPPMSFIPVLEKEGTVCDLDFYVFEQVCTDMRNWLDAGLKPVRISSNFSKIHLHDERLAEEIMDIINQYDIPPEYVEVELTEMTAADDMNSLVAFVNLMKKRGVNVSIDDFGTGYSSLEMLKELDVDVIKLDKTFLNENENRTRSEEIVIRNIVNMIDELGMDVLAEGVETAGQARFLQNIHCNVAQGYLYDKPLPHDEFENRLKKGGYENVKVG